MRFGNILCGRVYKIAVLFILAGLFLTACLTKVEKASNEGSKKPEEGVCSEEIKRFYKHSALDLENRKSFPGSEDIYNRLDELKKVTMELYKNMEIDPNDSDGFFNRGEIYRQFGENELAIVDYNKAVELNPNNPEHLLNRGLLLCEMGMINDSIRDLKEACKLGNENSCLALEMVIGNRNNK